MPTSEIRTKVALNLEKEKMINKIRSKSNRQTLIMRQILYRYLSRLNNYPTQAIVNKSKKGRSLIDLNNIICNVFNRSWFGRK
jgi:hypothetical protein